MGQCSSQHQRNDQRQPYEIGLKLPRKQLRAQFEELLKAAPSNADLLYSLALLSLQGNLNTEARTYFMNRSGQSVVALALFYRILPTEILVVHDELDLPPGTVKLKRGGGTAGHNGLKDTQARLTTADFWRLRIGIGHPRPLQLEQDVADFVLHPPRRDEQALIDEAIDRGEGIIELLACGKFEAAMKKLHTG